MKQLLPIENNTLDIKITQLNANLDQQWTIVKGKLHKEFIFKNFIEAFAFMSKIAIIAESQNHHPELFNCYNRVTIDLMTHEIDGLSEKDFKLASTIEEQYE